MTTKPRYRILWDENEPENPDFWEVGTKSFFTFIKSKYANYCYQYKSTSVVYELKTRIL